MARPAGPGPSDPSEDDPPPRLRARSLGDTIEVWREDGHEPLLVQHATPGRRPYIGPILAPDDTGEWVNRLSVALDDMNGIRFGSRGSEDGATAVAGTFHPLLLGPQHLDDGGVLWSVITGWRTPDGGSLLGESQRWTIADHGDAYTLDLEWTLSAHIDLAFGRDAVGGPVVWLAGWEAGSGTVLSSEGKSGAAVYGQRARWVDVGSNAAGPSAFHVAIMDHPGNPGHPVTWAADTHAGVVPDRFAAGPGRLPAGEMLAFRYRLFLSAGPADVPSVEAVWQDFARQDDDDAA